VVVPWTSLVAIDVEVDVPFVFTPCNLDSNDWDPSNLEKNWSLIHCHSCLQLSAFPVDGLLSSTSWTKVPKDGQLPQAIVFDLFFLG